MKRFLKYALFLMLLLLLIFLGSIGGAITTESGLRFLVQQAQLWVPGKLKVDSLEGRLRDKVSITGLSYQFKETAVKVGSFKLDWDADSLLNGQAHVKKLHIDRIEVHLPKTEEDKESEPFVLPDIKLPLKIALDDVKIDHLSIKIAGAAPLIIDSIELQSTTTDVLSLQHLLVKSPQFNAKLVGDVGLTAPHTVQLDLDWTAKLPEFTVVGEGKLSGNMQKLTLNHTVSKPLKINLKTTVKDVFGALDIDALLTWQEIYWPLNPAVPKDYLVNSQQGRVTLLGTLENYDFNLSAKVAGKQIPAGHWTIAAQGNQEEITLKELRSKILKGAISATGKVSWVPKLVAQVNLNTDKITIKDFWKEWPDQLRINSQLVANLDGDHFKIHQFDVNLPQTAAKLSLKGEGMLAGEKTRVKTATLAWQGVQWPLVGKESLVSSKKGKVSMIGSPQNYRVNLETQLAGAQIPPGDLAINGHGNLQQFTLESLRTDILKGVINTTGKISWQPKLVAEVKLNTDQITIKDFWKEWPDQLRINSQLVANLNGDHFKIHQFDVNLPQTAAKLSLKGEGMLAGEKTRLKTAILTWQGVQWPLVGNQSIVTSKNGWVNVIGTPQNYCVDLKTQLAGAQIPPGDLTVAGRGNLQQFTLESFRADILEGVINTTGKISWKPELVAEVNLNTDQITIKDFWKDWPDQLRINSQLVANLKGEHFKIHKLDVNLPQTAAKLSLKGEGMLAGEKTRLKTATLAWTGLQWPLVGKNPLVTSKKGQVNAVGTPEDYHVDFETQLAGAQIPPGHLAINGYGNLQQFTLESLRADILEGVINTTGKVSWQPELVAEVNLNTEQITIKDFWKDWPDQLRINSQLVANLKGEHFKIHKLDVNLPQTAAKLSLKGEGMLAGEKTRLKTATLAWTGLQWPLVGKNPLVTSKKGQVNAVGTPEDYHVDFETQLAGAQIPPGHLAINGYGNLQQFTLESLRADILEGVINTTGKVSWQPELVAEVNLNTDQITIKDFWKEWPDQLRINSQLVANLKGDHFKIHKLDVNLPQTAAKLSLQGEGSLAGKTPRFDATVAWQNVQWPLTGSPALVNTQKGTLHALGTPNDYQLNLNADIQGKDIPAGSWKATGSGNTSRFQFKNLQANILEGTLDLTGKVRWQPEINWQIALNGKNINPGSQYSEWPGKIALKVHSKGRLKNGHLETQVKLKHIKGQLREYPLHLKTEVAINNNSYKINWLDFKFGKIHLMANGKLGERSKLEWSLNAPDLATLLPEAQGSLSGKGNLTGSLNSPHITAKLNGNSLLFQENSLNAIAANINVNLHTQKELFLELIATDFKQGATEIDTLSLQVQGNFTAHHLIASLKMPRDDFSLKLQGGFKESRWQGKLQELTASTAKVGDWQLQAPADLTLSAEEARLAQVCLQQSQHKICTQLHWQKTAKSMVKATLENISLALFDAFLPPYSNLTGIINGDLATTLHPDGAIKSDMVINLSQGAFKTFLNNEYKAFPHQGGKFNLQITQTGLAAKLNFDLLEKSGIHSTFHLPGFTHLPLSNKQILQGEMKATFADLDILPIFVSQVEKTKGEINMEFKLGGIMEAPEVQGQIRMKNIATDLPELGLEIKALDVTILAEKENITLQGHLKSGEGKLNLKGTAKLISATDWKANLNIAGKNFKVIDTADAWGIVSPNIDVKAVPDRVDVRGKITIPELAITPSKATSEAVATSKDVVIVNPIESEPEEKKGSPAIAISSHVTIILGNKVTFDGAGFTSRFGGTVIASNNPGKITVGNGELYIIKGRYNAYGQNLKIDRGRVFFSGGPIENPGLDIKAYRRIKRKGNDDVIAGIHIQGTAQLPKLVLYSKPTYDESNTLSYMILGKPVAEVGKGESNLLLNAAAALPLKHGDKLTQKMGKQFGFDEAGISTEDGIEQAAFVLGKYLRPGLYVSYGIGLFDGNNVLRTRYELSKRLMLETELGTENGVDLRYSLER